MKSKFFKDNYTQVLFNISLDKQKNQTLRFLINVICLLLIVIMLQQKAIAQTLGINTTGALPDSSAMLDIISPTKGLLIPRVSLSSTVDTITITNPATSLLVYNTNVAMTGGSGLGYYYYNGSMWMNFLSGTGNSLTTPLIIGGSGTTSSLTYKPTTGVGTTGADHVFKVGDNGATEVMRILNNGNVGIGTTSPTAHLHVYSQTAGVNDQLAKFENYSSGTTGSAYISVISGTRSFDFEQNSGGGSPYRYGTYVDANIVNNYAGSSGAYGNINFVTGNAGGSAIAMTIGGGTQKGNVGIGTTAPTAKTQISGDFDASTINANALVIDAKLRTSTTNGLDKAGILVTPDFNTTNSNVANTYGIKIAPIQTGVYTTTNGYGLHVTAPTVTSGFLTNSYAASFNGGNVGIGTTAPPVMLTVLNSNSVKAAIAQSLTDVTTAPTTIATANYLQLGRQEFGTNSYRLIQFGYNSAATTNSPAYMGFQETAQTGVTKGDLVFGTRDVTTNTQASERMRILANGNVGIGVTVPIQKLHVGGGIALSGNPASARYILLNETSTGTTQFIIQAGAGSSGYGGAINTFGHSHATKPGWVTAGISVGGGTDGSATEGRFTVNNQALAGGTDVFTVLRTGNVGIGITAPTNKLHIYSNTAAQALFNGYSTLTSGVGDYNGTILIGNQATYQGVIDYNGSAPTALTIKNTYAGNTNSKIQFNVGGTDIVSMLKSGNVGIGTTTPNSTLQVNGALSLPIVNVTGNYTVLATDYTIYVSGGSAGVTTTVTLPTLVAGRIYVIKNASLGDVSLVGTIDSGTNLTISAAAMNPPQPVMVQGLGGAIGWVVISRQ